MFRRHVLLRHVRQWCCGGSTTNTRHPITSCLSAAFAQPNTISAARLTEQLGVPKLSGQQQLRFSHMTNMVDRGAYDERWNQHVTGSDVSSLQVVSDGKLLHINWGDGHVSKFHSLWLRYNCFCADCRVEHTGQYKMLYDQVPDVSRIISATDDGEGSLIVQWQDEPDHTGMFPLKFLRAHCYTREALQKKRDSIRMKFSKDNVIPRVSYDDVMASKAGVYKWVKALSETGLTIVEGVPCQEGMVKKVCARVADFPQHTIYGETFDVVASDQPLNAAYSAGELKLHMDLCMYEAPPGIQALHCMQFDKEIVGGDSFYVDLFQVAETFREKFPQEFDLLCKVPITLERNHYKRDWPVHMLYRRPMFALNHYGDLTGVVWHPGLMGPLQVEEEYVEPFYQAVKKFYVLINNYPNMFWHRLQPGELVAFNNRRVLHARTAFDSHGGKRFLQGCYIEMSEFRSCVQVLSNLEGDGGLPVRLGDYDML